MEIHTHKHTTHTYTHTHIHENERVLMTGFIFGFVGCRGNEGQGSNGRTNKTLTEPAEAPPTSDNKIKSILDVSLNCQQ